MATPVEVPKLGNTVEECLVSRWLKHKGDTVAAGDVVAEIETDKATFEVTAPVEGTLLETFFDEGALVPVFTTLFVIGDAGESVVDHRAAAPSKGPDQKAVASTPVANGPAPAAASAPIVPIAAPSTASAFSPRARRFAEEHRFYPTAVAGSGPGGRVLEEDLRALYYTGPGNRTAAGKRAEMSLGAADMSVCATSTSAPAPTSASASASGTASVPGPAQASTRGPGTSIRDKIARRMRESLTTTAQYTLNSSANASGLLILRARIKASTGVTDININDLVAFCAIRALLDVPAVNAEYIDGRIQTHAEVHLGFACDTPRGLLVPVVRNAHAMSAAELATAMKSLTAKAVQGNISPDDLSGGTFTVSNLGGLGIESFTPLLNPPQVAILGVGAIQVKPVRQQGKLEFIDAIGLSLTCDHQVIDGAPGARFLQVVKEKIENVERLCTI